VCILFIINSTSGQLNGQSFDAAVDSLLVSDEFDRQARRVPSRTTTLTPYEPDHYSDFKEVVAFPLDSSGNVLIPTQHMTMSGKKKSKLSNDKIIKSKLISSTTFYRFQ